MKRKQYFVNSIELNIPILAVAETLSTYKDGDGKDLLYWKGLCSGTEKECKLITQISKDNILSILINNVDIVVKGSKLKCDVLNLEEQSSIKHKAHLDSEKDELIENGDPNYTNNDTVKRKRGRPRKTDQVEHVQEKSIKANENTNEAAPILENETKRYGLRGVKLSEAVMRAEMGSNYKEKTVNDSNEGNLTSTANQAHVVDTTDNPLAENDGNTIIDNDENYDDDNKDADYIDSDYVGYVSENEEEYDSKRKFGSVFNQKGQKRKNKIDIGDVKIPKYKKDSNLKKDKECKYCQKLFYHYVGIEDHVRKYHMKEKDVESYLEELKDLRIEICKICNKTFNNRYYLIEHEKRSHLENTSVKCFKCDKMYKNVQSLKNHIRAVHSVTGQPFSCNQCSARFKWSTTLKQHIEEIHEGKMKALCKHCGKRFPRQNLLNRHMRIHGTDQSKRLLCKFCGKGFWYEHNLQRHMKVIHGPHQENFHCSYCGKGFNMKSAMVTHVQQVHFSIFPFRCNECNLGFKRSKLYRLHMVTEHQVIDVNTTGPQRFKYGKTEEDLFYCSHCSLSFCYKTKMVEHMHSAHKEDFPYMCTHCNQGFLEKSFLSHHLLKAHDEILPPDETKEEEESRFQMVTIDINGEKKDLEVESFNLPQPVIIEKTEEVENVVNLEIKENQDTGEETPAQSLFFEVSKGSDTIHYVIEQSANGDPTILPQELANLLLAAEQSLQGIDKEETGEIQFVTNDCQEIIDSEYSVEMIEEQSVGIDQSECSVENS